MDTTFPPIVHGKLMLLHGVKYNPDAWLDGPDRGEHVGYVGTARITYTGVDEAPCKSVRTTVTAGEDCRWKTKPGHHKPSFTPTHRAARSDEQGVAIQNLLIGEVWIASAAVPREIL